MIRRQLIQPATGALLAVLVGFIGVGEAQAQRAGRMGGPGGARGAGGTLAGPQMMRGGPAQGVERALRLSTELGLSEGQLDELETLRQEQVAARSDAMSRMMELGSEVRAGIREPEALRQEMRALRDARAQGAEGARDRLAELLTEEQVAELQELTRPGRGGRGEFRGRRMQRGQRGFRGQRGRSQGGPPA